MSLSKIQKTVVYIVLGIIIGSVLALGSYGYFSYNSIPCYVSLNNVINSLITIIIIFLIGGLVGGFISHSLKTGTIAGLIIGIVCYTLQPFFMFSKGIYNCPIEVIVTYPQWITVIDNIFYPSPFGIIILCVVGGIIGGSVGGFIVSKIHKKRK